MPFGSAVGEGFVNPGVFEQVIVVPGRKGGIFTYFPTVGFNNLIASTGIAQGGTDKYGNVYLPGDTTYSFNTTYGIYVAINLYGSVIGFFKAASEAGPWTFNPTNPWTGVPSIGYNGNNLLLSGSIQVQGNIAGGVYFADPSGMNVHTRWIFPSGDTTGLTDTNTLIQTFGTLGVKRVILLPGTFYIQSTVTVPDGCVLEGSGINVTIVTVAAGLSPGTPMFFASGAYPEICAMTITGINSNITGNPQSDAIFVQGGRTPRIHDIFFQYVNNWCINLTVGTVGSYGASFWNIWALNCAGGINVQSNAGVSYEALAFLNTIDLQHIGTASNLDALRLQDAEDIQILNYNGAISNLSTGSTCNIQGHCALIYGVSWDLGCEPVGGAVTNNVITIQDFGGNFPRNIHLVDVIGQQGQTGLTITGNARAVDIAYGQFSSNLGTGVVMAGTGFNINFDHCRFDGNGVAGVGTNYELNWSGAAQGTVEHCTFESAIVASGTANGVQFVANVNNLANLTARDWHLLNSGISSAFVFPSGVNSPQVSSDIDFWNPRGAQAVAIPGAGVPVAAAAVDRYYYITTGAAGPVTITVSGASPFIIIIPANTTNQVVFVPQGATIKWTVNAPTSWLVQGN